MREAGLGWWLFLATAVACSSPPGESKGYVSKAPQFSEQHERALRAMGIKDAKPAEYSLFVCAESDSVFNSAGFEANGVKGMVCCGWMKGCTVRIQ